MEQPVHRALADALDRKTVRQRHCDTAANSPDRRASSVQARAPPPTPDPPPACARRRGDANVLKESHSKTPNQAPPARTVPIPVASTTRPMARASVAAHRRRARSFRTGRNTTNLDRSVSTIASMTSLIVDPRQKQSILARDLQAMVVCRATSLDLDSVRSFSGPPDAFDLHHSSFRHEIPVEGLGTSDTSTSLPHAVQEVSTSSKFGPSPPWRSATQGPAWPIGWRAATSSEARPQDGQ